MLFLCSKQAGWCSISEEGDTGRSDKVILHVIPAHCVKAETRNGTGKLSRSEVMSKHTCVETTPVTREVFMKCTMFLCKDNGGNKEWGTILDN